MNSPELNSYDFSQYIITINNVINKRLENIKNCLDGCLVETVGDIQSDFEDYFNSYLNKFNCGSVDETKRLTTKTEILKSKETFDSLVTCLPVDSLLSFVENQHKQLEQVITDLGHGGITAENTANLINKRIKQLEESLSDDFARELFCCEVSACNRILENTTTNDICFQNNKTCQTCRHPFY